VLKEYLELDIKVVGYNIKVVLNIRLDNLLIGLIITYKIVSKLEEVLLEVVLLYISITSSYKYRYYRLG